MLVSTIPLSILGSKLAGRRSSTVSAPSIIFLLTMIISLVPIVGMLRGATVSGVVMALSYILKEFQASKDNLEIYFAFGATRVEACRPLAVQALKLALTPAINSMRYALRCSFRNAHFMLLHSVLGILVIPGMMTSAILGGSSVQ